MLNFKRNQLRTIFSIIIAAQASMPAFAAGGDIWNIDPRHSSAHFIVKHMMISNVGGDLGHITGTVEYNGKDLTKATVKANIDASSIDTHEPNRDAHLKSPDFLNVDKFPSISFRSKKVEPEEKGKFKLIGDLTICGITKEVALDAEGPSAPIKDPHGNTRIGVSADAVINRKDFGINFNKTIDNGGALVGDDIKVELNIEMTQALRAAQPAGARSANSVVNR